MRELGLFSGAGGGLLGGHLLGWETVGACEIEEYPRAVLLQRQLDGLLPRFPIWDDICKLNGKQFRGKIDIITGGFPCQDISAAGKGVGITGEKSGLWTEMFRIICEVRPRYVFVENSPMLTSRGLGIILGNFSEIGFSCEWTVLGADDVGAPHRRKRIWILGYSRDNGFSASKIGESTDKGIYRSQAKQIKAMQSQGSSKSEINADVAYSLPDRLQGIGTDGATQRSTGLCSGTGSNKNQRLHGWWDIDPANIPDSRHNRDEQRDGELRESEQAPQGGSHLGRGEKIYEERERWAIESRLDRVVNGVPHRVDRLKAIGNAQVSKVAAVAFTVLMNRIKGYEIEKVYQKAKYGGGKKL